jgi:hypothetical protein
LDGVVPEQVRFEAAVDYMRVAGFQSIEWAVNLNTRDVTDVYVSESGSFEPRR